MLESFEVHSFKSLADVTVPLGVVNVFVGANGSGKSNLLEGLGILSAAANGRVDDPSLLQRGVRPGVPALYKSAFADPHGTQPSHISIAAKSVESTYSVTLNNPISSPEPSWRYKHEVWERRPTRIKIVGRGPATKERPNPYQGLAALKAVELEERDPAVVLLRDLQTFLIYAPTTAVLRGITPDAQTRFPLGLSGGRLAQAVRELLGYRRVSPLAQKVCGDSFGMIPWAKSFTVLSAGALPLSPSAATSEQVVSFVDKFMKDGRNRFSGYDASEGALYVLFHAVLAAHPASPPVCAVDNADHGLNPKLATTLFKHLSEWYLAADAKRQILLTTHNPAVLDGLPLQDDRVRLFVVERTNTGRTAVRRIEVDEQMLKKAKEGWTLSRMWMAGLLGGLADV